MTSGSPRALVVGGGIGGLCAGLCLAAVGVEVEVFEAADEIAELGVGLNVQSVAVGVLAERGLLPALDAAGVQTGELLLMTRRGQLVLRQRRGLVAGAEYPQLSIHRGHLQGVLRERLDELAPGAIHVGHRLRAVEERAGSVTAVFDVDGHETTARGDVLIGADGIRSTVRTQLLEGDDEPRWNGSLMWRGAADWPTFLTGASMIVAGGNAAKVVVYPIGPGRSPTTRLTNWAVVLHTAPAGQPPPRPLSWTEPADRAELTSMLERFRLADVDLPGLVAATAEVWVYPMCDRDPLRAWSTARTTLLGDAAHPMYPMGSNGASQAILDAHVLADALARTPAIDAALRRYESLRIPPTTQLVHLNRQGGRKR